MEEQELIVPILLLLACGTLHDGASCELVTAGMVFTSSPAKLHQSPHSWPEIVSCRGRPCSPITCAMACMQKDKCTVISYNPTSRTCIISRRPDDVSTNYETDNSNWNTYYRDCPVQKGYELHTGHYPPLCLRLDKGPVLHPAAESSCLAEGANLVRVKTLDIYDTVRKMLNESEFSLHMGVYIGADDQEKEGTFLWNDGTALSRGTNLWQSASEGYNAGEDCTAVSLKWKIWDTTCLKHPRGFVCQYDL